MWEARGTAGVDSASTGGTWDISNADRIGKGEATVWTCDFTHGYISINADYRS